MLNQQYCLRWKHHHTNVQSMFAQLLEKERFCDVTLYCSSGLGQGPGRDSNEDFRGTSLRAHRVVLAACSELLGSLLGAHESHGEPVLVIDGADARHIRALLDYMYTGEMSVHQSQLPSLLKTAEELRIKGLTDIRWNNKDEPPDYQSGSIMTTTSPPSGVEVRRERVVESPPSEVHKEDEKCSVNGGPPPLIKLTPKEKTSPLLKRDASDSELRECVSPKRQRAASGTSHTDDEDKDPENSSWSHGNMDITAERVVGWGENSGGSWAGSGEEWEEPTDIGSFLDTRLQVDGDNSGDEESLDGAPLSTCSSVSAATDQPCKGELTVKPLVNLQGKIGIKLLPSSTCPKSSSASAADPRFSDVVKLNDYLRHGRRPQFWEEEYVRRVMEAVRLKELEMKQAAEILGVSYGTLYGRYRDVYGCINRPYRNARDFWSPKGPSEVLERFQRGDISIDVAAQALGVTTNHLAGYYTEMPQEKEFEPIPIEIDPSLKLKTNFTPTTAAAAISAATSACLKSMRKAASVLGAGKDAKPEVKVDEKVLEKGSKKLVIGSLNDDEAIPATVISMQDSKKPTNSTTPNRWPSIRVASLENLRATPSSSSTPERSTSPTQLMKSRPDLTIVAAKSQGTDNGNAT